MNGHRVSDAGGAKIMIDHKCSFPNQRNKSTVGNEKRSQQEQHQPNMNAKNESSNKFAHGMRE